MVGKCPDFDESAQNTHRTLHALSLDSPKASFDANVALRLVLETYFDEAMGFERLGLTPELERTVRYLRSKGAETESLWEDGWTATQFAGARQLTAGQVTDCFLEGGNSLSDSPPATRSKAVQDGMKNSELRSSIVDLDSIVLPHCRGQAYVFIICSRGVCKCLMGNREGQYH